MAPSRVYYKYCAVYGCRNSSNKKPTLSFFKLPTDDERRSQWLYMIRREELIDKASHNYTICEEHFEAEYVLTGQQRKKLKTNAIPTLCLPVAPKKEKIEQEQKPIIEVLTLVEKCIQTDDINFPSTENQQCPSPGGSQKRKWNTDDVACRKTFKLSENDATDKTDMDTFQELSNKFLTKELSELIKTQIRLKYNHNVNSRNHKMFCLNLYYTSTRTYQLLQSAMCLPSINTVINKREVPITTEINERTMETLKTKVQVMSNIERNCSVLVDSINLKANLLYDATQDKIIGFHDIDGMQTLKLAKTALVVMVSGILINWKQPVGYALLSRCVDHDEIAKWIEKLLEKLLEIGLNVKALISNIGSDWLDASRIKTAVSIDQPYFLINDKKIYKIFDASNLMKLVQEDLMIYDVHYENRVAKYENVLKFYEYSKLNNSTQSFTSNDEPTSSPILSEETKVHQTKQLNSSIASGISKCVDLNIMDETARDTAEFIKKINNLYDTLNSTSINDTNEYKKAFRGKESQITFFKEMLSFLESLKFFDSKNGNESKSNVEYVYGFQITILSILQLFNDLKLEGCTFLLTSRLNLEPLKAFFNQTKPKNGSREPTSFQLMSAFRKLFYSEIAKPPKEGSGVDNLEHFISQTNKLEQQDSIISTGNDVVDTNDDEPDDNIKITSSDYNQLDWPDKNSLFYVCAYLLEKCVVYHKNCQILKTYIQSDQESCYFDSSSYQRYKDYIVVNNKNVTVDPCDDFIKFVEEMDIKFRDCFKRQHLNYKLAAFIYKEMKDIDFLKPCPCFPIAFLKKLFIRMRIYNMVKFNNKALRSPSKNRMYFKVNSLS